MAVSVFISTMGFPVLVSWHLFIEPSPGHCSILVIVVFLALLCILDHLIMAISIMDKQRSLAEGIAKLLHQYFFLNQKYQSCSHIVVYYNVTKCFKNMHSNTNSFDCHCSDLYTMPCPL